MKRVRSSKELVRTPNFQFSGVLEPELSCIEKFKLVAQLTSRIKDEKSTSFSSVSN